MAEATRRRECDNPFVPVPELQFAFASDGVRIAFQRFGSGPPTVIVGEELNHIVVLWDQPEFRRSYEYLAEHLDLMLYDQRGSGNSDRVESSTVAERLLDIDAVLDAGNIERTSLIGRGSGAIVAAAYASARPDRVARVVIANGRVTEPFADEAWELADDHLADRDEVRLMVQEIWEKWGVDAAPLVAFTNPSMVDDPAVLRWWTRYQRVVVSRGEALREAADSTRLRAPVAEMQFEQPALITHMQDDRLNHIGHGRLWSQWLPHATFEAIEGDDHEWYLASNWRAVSSKHASFITGEKVDAPGVRRYAAILFTDIASSTALSLEAGNQEWRTKLDKHDRAATAAVGTFDGTVVKNTGDGILATFDNPASAIEASIALRSDLDQIGVVIRAGIHAGIIEVREEDISGSVVNLAARTMGAAPDGEIYVTSSVKDQLLGSSIRLVSAGAHKLKGFQTTRELFRVSN